MIFTLRRSNSGSLFARKVVNRFRVVKTGREYLTLSAYPESYGDLSTIKAPISECYTDLEDAKAAADGKAAELIAQIVTLVEKLKAPAAVCDQTRELTPFTE